MVRPLAWLCCFLAATTPTWVVVRAAVHAHEHAHVAAAEAGHSHEDGHVPHHRHDPAGEPIPASTEVGRWAAARPAAGESVLVPPALPGVFAGLMVDAHLASRPALGGCGDRSSRFPTAPSPGRSLPLLI